jgi:hypothetical protein
MTSSSTWWSTASPRACDLAHVPVIWPRAAGRRPGLGEGARGARRVLSRAPRARGAQRERRRAPPAVGVCDRPHRRRGLRPSASLPPSPLPLLLRDCCAEACGNEQSRLQRL